MRTCAWCDEPLEPPIYPGGMHRECSIRMMIGSVAHQSQMCSCFGGPPDDLPPGRTLREDARVAAELFDARMAAVDAAKTKEALQALS